MKDKIVRKFTTEESRTSINESGRMSGEVDAPLLEGDFDEETRQSARVAEAEKAGVEGANERIGA